MKVLLPLLVVGLLVACSSPHSPAQNPLSYRITYTEFSGKYALGTRAYVVEYKNGLPIYFQANASFRDTGVVENESQMCAAQNSSFVCITHSSAMRWGQQAEENSTPKYVPFAEIQQQLESLNLTYSNALQLAANITYNGCVQVPGECDAHWEGMACFSDGVLVNLTRDCYDQGYDDRHEWQVQIYD